jgi:hypothetical protein
VTNSVLGTIAGGSAAILESIRGFRPLAGRGSTAFGFAL